MNLTETSKKSSQLVTEDNENKETAEDGGVKNISASVDNTPKNMESDKADNAEENAPTCEIMVDIDLDMDDTDDTDDCHIEGMGPVEPYEKSDEADEPVFSENDTDNPDPVEDKDKDKKNEDNKDNKNKFKIVIVKRKNAATGLIKQRDKEYEEHRRKRDIAEPTRQNVTPDMDI